MEHFESYRLALTRESKELLKAERVTIHLVLQLDRVLDAAQSEVLQVGQHDVAMVVVRRGCGRAKEARASGDLGEDVHERVPSRIILANRVASSTVVMSPSSCF